MQLLLNGYLYNLLCRAISLSS